MFPHHECEIAQSTIAHGHVPANYWMHNNMITINGQKMGKSLGNFITLEEFFSGNHKLLTQAYDPMTIRFFILQAHYRSTLDFSNEALQAAQKGLQRLMEAYARMDKLTAGEKSDFNITEWQEKCHEALNDDLNSPILISHLFEAVKWINSMVAGQATLTADDLKLFNQSMHLFVEEILGLKNSIDAKGGGEVLKNVIDLLLTLRMEAKARKDWATTDKIRNELQAMGVLVKDTKDGFEWELK